MTSSESAIDQYCTARISLTQGSVPALKKAKPPGYIVVRYCLANCLNRPGYDAKNSAGRIWKDPPPVCTPGDIREFLQRQGILNGESVIPSQQPLLCEILLDSFSCYVELGVCEEEGILFDFTGATLDRPGLLSVRLTDVSALHPSAASVASVKATKHSAASPPRTLTSMTTRSEIPTEHEKHLSKGPPSPPASAAPQTCNTTHIGLFTVSFTLWLEAVDLFGKLVEGTVSPYFTLVWGPTTFFSSGFLLVLVGLNEARRNNVFGTTIFFTIGSSWLSSGFTKILLAYFPDEIDPILLQPDPVGKLLLGFWYILFIGVMAKQTFIMSRFATTLVSALLLLTTCRAVSGWSRPMEWIQLVAGVIAAFTAFYGFMAELTNEMHHKKVFNLYPWKNTATVGITEEVWGAPGRISDLQARAIELRMAHARQ
jgi:succinate-acetate transporter protein